MKIANWKCPNCHKMNAFFVKECSKCGSRDIPPTETVGPKPRPNIIPGGVEEKPRKKVLENV